MQFSRSGDGWSSVGDEGSHRSSENMGETKEQDEVQSHLKQQAEPVPGAKGRSSAGMSQQLDLQEDATRRPPPLKRKNKVSGLATQTPDLNIPLAGSTAIEPMGLVKSREPA